MTLEFTTERTDAPEGLAELLEEVAEACVRAEGITVPVYASLQLIGDEEIHEQNLRLRGVDRPTDVLSFPTVNYPDRETARLHEKLLRREYDISARACFLGDILISLPRAKEQAEEYGHPLRRELCYLTAHAMFHLMGYDHMTDEDKPAMRAMEEQALRLLAPRDTEPTVTDEQLYAMAEGMLERSYAPYSGFHVGAALLCADGRVYTGCNFENSSYGATICAERCAASCAIAAGSRRFVRIAVVGSSAVAWPCGICRQVLNEFAVPGMEVIAGEHGKPFFKKALAELLPCSFGPEDLNVQV